MAGSKDRRRPSTKAPLLKRKLRRVPLRAGWIREQLNAARLVSVPEAVASPLETAIGGLLVRGLAWAGFDDGERDRLLSKFGASKDRERTREVLREVAIAVARRRHSQGARRGQLATAFLGLLVLLQRDGQTLRWGARDHRRLQLLEEWNDLPRPLLTIASVIRRHPMASTSKAVERELWDVMRDFVIAPDSHEFRGPSDQPAGGQTPAANPPVAQFNIDLDEDGLRHLVVNGRRMQYGSSHRGGQLTRRHRATRLLLDLVSGVELEACDAESLRDLRRALERATDGELTVERQAGRYVLSRPVAVSARLLALRDGR